MLDLFSTRDLAVTGRLENQLPDPAENAIIGDAPDPLARHAESRMAATIKGCRS
jgi:hypothetical protein